MRVLRRIDAFVIILFERTDQIISPTNTLDARCTARRIRFFGRANERSAPDVMNYRVRVGDEVGKCFRYAKNAECAAAFSKRLIVLN